MGAMKGTGSEKAFPERPPQGISNPQVPGKSFPCRIYCLFGLSAGGLAVGLAICTVLVYKERLEALQSRVEVLELHCLDVQTTMRDYIDERLRNMLLHQVSKRFRLRKMQTVVTDVRGVCPSVCPSVTAAQPARLRGAGVIRSSLCQITLAYCFLSNSLLSADAVPFCPEF